MPSTGSRPGLRPCGKGCRFVMGDIRRAPDFNCDQFSIAINGTARNVEYAVLSDSSSIFIKHRGPLLNYATRLVGSRAEAEDLVQEAWLRLDAAAGERAVQEPLGYLYRIIRNLAFDQSRSAGRERQWQKEGEASVEAVLGLKPSATPENIVLHKDQMRLLMAALDELPKRTRVAFGMHRLGGYKLREIAAFLDISIPLAQKLVTTGLLHCRDRLGWP
jgi:RNA polymerase sigma factor (sigma-70 family)